MFAAGVGGGGQRVEQRGIEISAAKRHVDLTRIDTHEYGFKSVANEIPSEIHRRLTPERKGRSVVAELDAVGTLEGKYAGAFSRS